MAHVLARLYHMTGVDDCRQRAEALFDTFSGTLAEHPLTLVTMINAFEHLQAAMVVVIVGPDSQAAAWRYHVLAVPASDLIVLSGPADSPLVQGRPMINGALTAYICRGQTCSAPVTTIEALVQALTEKDCFT